LCLISLLKLAVHVSLFLVHSTDQIGIVQFLKDDEGLVQVLISLLLFEEFPILIALHTVDNAVVARVLLWLIPVDQFQGLLKELF
jgi:hypothetical protein